VRKDETTQSAFAAPAGQSGYAWCVTSDTGAGCLSYTLRYRGAYLTLIFTRVKGYAVGCYLRYRWFPRRTLLRDSVNRGNPGLLARYRRKTLPLTASLFAAIVKE